MLCVVKNFDVFELLIDGIEVKVCCVLNVFVDFLFVDIIEVCEEDNFDCEILFEFG